MSYTMEDLFAELEGVRDILFLMVGSVEDVDKKTTQQAIFTLSREIDRVIDDFYKIDYDIARVNAAK